jgi:uncharacterized repeat protein (TIGR03806 family)
MAGTGGAGDGGSTAGSAGSAGSSAGAGASGASGTGGSGSPTWGIETRPTGQTCVTPETTSAQPMLLSESGCVDPADPTKPAATLLPYDVASPLWSDNAEKHRFIALPDGMNIHVRNCTTTPAECDPPEDGGTGQDDGDWDFPIGTVLVKTFSLGGKLVETRLLMRKREFDWWGFSYRWREDQSDAELLASNTDGYDGQYAGPDGMQNWHFPSRQQCLQCHSTAAGVALGPDTSQLNFDFTYPNGVVGNQLETLEHIAVFDAPPTARAVYPTPSDEAQPVEERARSYLHSNCSLCHRPGGTYSGIDFRFTTPFEDTGLCGQAPEKGDLGVAGALRITPGDPEHSVLSLRMHTLDTAFRMPQIGTGIVDDTGTGVVDAWISSLTSCP